MCAASRADARRSPVTLGAEGPAESTVTEAVREPRRAGDAQLTATMYLVRAGELWLDQIDRLDSGMSRRTIVDYAGLWKSYVGGPDSALRRLTLAQVNDPQRLRLFLQGIADLRGTVSAKAPVVGCLPTP